MALTLFGVAIIVISPFLSTTWPIVVFLLGIAVILGVAYLLAKEAYEKEELSEEALEKPKKIIELPDIRKYLYAQTIMITAYHPLLGKAPWELLLIMLFMLFMTSSQENRSSSRFHRISQISWQRPVLSS